MASWYVYSAAAGAGTGADWANAFTTINAAITAGAAGDTYYLAHDHAQTQASALTITFKGTVTAIDRVLCVNRAGSVPPVAADLTTGASITTTASNSMTITGVSNFAYIEGVTFNSGTLANATQIIISLGYGYFKNSNLKKLGTSSSSNAMIIGGTAGVCTIILDNTPFTFSNTADGLNVRGVDMLWKNSSAISGGSIPTTLFRDTASFATRIRCLAVDFNGLTGGSNVLAASFTPPILLTCIDCKLPSTFGGMDTSGQQSGGRVELINTDNSNNYTTAVSAIGGKQTIETTVVHTGGATDGTTPISWKIVSDTRAKYAQAFEPMPDLIWNTVTGSSITVTMQMLTDNVTLTNADIWFEVTYLGSSSSPLGSLATTGVATVLTAGSNYTTSSETWTTTGIVTPVKQFMAVTFTPQKIGFLNVQVKVAKTSTTIYLDPKLVVT